MADYNVFLALKKLESRETFHSAMIAAIVEHDEKSRDLFFNMLKDKENEVYENGKLKNKNAFKEKDQFKVDELKKSIVKDNRRQWIDTEVHLIEYVTTEGNKIKKRDRGRADIWIGTNNGKNDSNQYRLIIENKINAKNQYCQLRKYYRYLTGVRNTADKDQRKFAGLFFLCVNRSKEYINQAMESAKEFNSETQKGEATKYAIITYEDDIIPWLCDVWKESSGSFKKAVGDYLELVELLVKKRNKRK